MMRGFLFERPLPRINEIRTKEHPEISQASYVLQTRGCRPDVQKGALDCLSVLLGTGISGNLKIPLLRDKEQCDSD